MINKINVITQSEQAYNNNFVGLNNNSPRKMTRDEANLKKKEMSSKNYKEIHFDRFTKIILDFALINQEKFLMKLKKYFENCDKDNDGIVNESEFIQLLKSVGIIDSEEDENLEIILAKADPNNTQSLTFSDCVLVFTETEVEVEDSSSGTQRYSTINVIDKINKFDHWWNWCLKYNENR